jgi:hypothetical protein
MIRVRGFSLPKVGRTEIENEDAFEIDVAQGVAAVADGSTDSSFSKAWARLLVDSFKLCPLDPSSEPEALKAWLDRPQAMWQRMLEGRPLPWHAQHKVARGAFAAFVAADIRSDGTEVYWSALGVGDCCFFVVEQDRLAVAFPLDDPDAFGSTPFLVGTNPAANVSLAEHVGRRHGRAAEGSLFLLMTDALSHWFLSRAREGGRPWQDLLALEGDEAFAAWVAARREEKVLHNDDTTLVIWET